MPFPPWPPNAPSLCRAPMRIEAQLALLLTLFRFCLNLSFPLSLPCIQQQLDSEAFSTLEALFLSQ